MIEENKLTEDEIKNLILNKNVSGKVFGLEWIQSRNDEGKFEYRDYFGRTHIGESWVDEDEICYQFESLYDGIKYCAEIYKNPEGNKNELSEYLYLTDYWLTTFSIIETFLQDSPPKEEVSATTINSNNVAINLIGEWDTVSDLKEYGVYKDVVQITQTGNTFVGIKLIGTQFSPKGSETIKGDVEDNIIRSMFLKTTLGWLPAEWIVNEQGDEILMKVHMDSIGLTIDVKLTRK